MRATEQDLETLYRRVNNAFVDRLELSFHPEDSILLYHLRASASHLQCQIGALRVQAKSVEIDYLLVDFVGVHLKPKAYEMSVWSEDDIEEYERLYTHNALRGNVTHLAYDVSTFLFNEKPRILGGKWTEFFEVQDRDQNHRGT